jgi:hypothetical protein
MSNKILEKYQAAPLSHQSDKNLMFLKNKEYQVQKNQEYQLRMINL